jgi:hypothetical protein
MYTSPSHPVADSRLSQQIKEAFDPLTVSKTRPFASTAAAAAAAAAATSTFRSIGEKAATCVELPPSAAV